MSSDPNINTSLGLKVKNLRTKRKITRETLAERIGVSSRFLADVEAGKVGISLSTLVNICGELAVSADYLLGISSNDEDTEYDEAINRIKRIPAEYMDYLNRIITAYSDAVNS